MPLYRQLELHALGLRRARRANGPLAELVAGAHPPHAFLELSLVVLRRLDAAPVEPGVTRDDGRKLRREEIVEVLLDFDVDLERAVTECGGSGLARGARRRVQGFLAVADAR